MADTDVPLANLAGLFDWFRGGGGVPAAPADEAPAPQPAGRQPLVLWMNPRKGAAETNVPLSSLAGQDWTDGLEEAARGGVGDHLDRSVKSGAISQAVADRFRAGDILGAWREYLAPSYLHDVPSSPQADVALADPNARPGKIGPPSGPPTATQIAGGIGTDIAANLLPELKVGVPALAAIGGGIKRAAGEGAGEAAERTAEAAAPVLERVTDPAEFHGHVKEAHETHTFGSSVTVHSPQDYAGMRTYLSPDKSAGYALDGDNIVSVFKKPGSDVNVTDLINEAVANGGRRLDAFDTVLPGLYGRHGFRATGRVKWNDQFAPDTWDYDLYNEHNQGRPDVVFMVHDPSYGSPYRKPQAAVPGVGGEKGTPRRAGDGSYFKTYDEADANNQREARIGEGPTPLVSMPAAVSGVAPAPLDKKTLDAMQIRAKELELGNKDLPTPEPGWLSVRNPTGAGIRENPNHPFNPYSNPLVSNLNAVLADPKFLRDAAQKVREMRGVPDYAKSGSTDEDVLRSFMTHLRDNLLWLHDTQNPAFIGESAKWYDGGNAIAQEMARRLNIPLQDAATMVAVLSPQKDWHINVDLAQRVGDILQNRQNEPMTNAMVNKAHEIYDELINGRIQRTETGRAILDDNGNPVRKINERTGKVEPEDRNLIDRLVRAGTLANQRTMYDKAAWLRLFDETYGDPSYTLWAPDGTPLGYMKTKGGANASRAWGPLGDIEKAVRAYYANGDARVLQEAIGDALKVPNFRNNLGVPMSRMHDVTVDTHQGAAALLRPLAASDPEVSTILSGAPSSSLTGNHGLYGIVADATRNAAYMRDLLPRMMQSIGWEAGKGLFGEAFKTKANKEAIRNLWESAKSPEDAARIRAEILRMAGGIDPPVWAGKIPNAQEPAGWPRFKK